MAEPRTTREALITKMPGELDALFSRAERLPNAITDSEVTLIATVVALDKAGDQYRMAITAFTEQARVDLTEYLQRKAGEVASKTVEEQRSALQGAAHAAFRSEAFDRATRLGTSLSEAAKESLHGMGSRLLEHGLTALLATLTAGLVLHLVRHN